LEEYKKDKAKAFLGFQESVHSGNKRIKDLKAQILDLSNLVYAEEALLAMAKANANVTEKTLDEVEPKLDAFSALRQLQNKSILQFPRMELPEIWKAMKLETKDDIEAIKDVYATLQALSSYGLDLHKDHVMGEIDVSKSLNMNECKSNIAKLLHISMGENASKRMTIEMAEPEECSGGRF
jgi:hypothetical protein